jgi:hypothetical protein
VLSILAEKNNFCSEYKGNAGIVMDFITPLGHPVFPKKHQWEQIKLIAGVAGKKLGWKIEESLCFINC